MDLLSTFRAALPAGAKVSDEIGTLLAEICARCEAAHPQFTVERVAFVRALAERLPAGGDPHAALASMRVTDVYLALAAAGGEPVAVAAVRAMLSTEADAAGRALRADASMTEEVKQRLATKLLVDTQGQGPALRDYAGRGDLRGFLRISATRDHLKLLRTHRREVELPRDDLGTLAPALDPELERLKHTYRAQFTECFVEALRSLTPRERAILRHQAVDQLSIDQIAAIYGTHRATAARWLERARVKVAEKTEELLAARLAIDSVEAASVIRLVRSQLHVTLERLLADDGG